MRFYLNSFLFLLLMSMAANAAMADERILFSRLTEGYWQIWSMDPKGQHQLQLTSSAVDKRGPDWLPLKKKISYRTSNGEVFIADPDGKNETQVLAQYGSISNPHFSKVSDAVVFMRFDSPLALKNNIWVSDLSGHYSRILTKGAWLHYQPDFSPKADKIVYIRVDRPARVHRVWVMNADGSAPRQVTFNTQGYEHSPAFAPDGKSVVFSANTVDNDDEIYMIRLDSRKPVRLTHHAGVDTHPRFSPDGKNIVFVSINKGVQQIVVMDVAGGNIVPLTQGPDDAVDPVWVE